MANPLEGLDAEFQRVSAAPTQKKFEPSAYQADIFRWIESEPGNAVVEAVAGSGKTTTLLESLSRMSGRPYFVAFNKHIAEELSRRAPNHAQVSTIHSLGFSAIRKALGRVEVDGHKMKKIVKEIMGDEFDDRIARTAAEKLASITKLTLTDPADRSAVEALIDRYDIDANGQAEWVTDCLPDLIKSDREEASTIDFDDMVYLPHALGVQPRKNDWMCIDETQDLNTAQRELVLKAVSKSGRVLAVGDSKQAIYAFSGADTSSIGKITKRLSAKTLPLSICYRCPASHIELAKELVPQIEARPGAPEGVVKDLSRQKLVRNLRDGDLVICRINAPLAEIAMDLIRAGKKAVLRGKDISTGLLNVIKKQRGVGEDIGKLLRKLVDYRDRETAKLVKAEKDRQADSLRDRVETIIALSDGIQTVTGLTDRISSIFRDDKTGIVCSSVHRAKGLEADRVTVYKPSLMPFPKAKGEEEMAQEYNLRYISLTRAKQELWFVEE